MKLTWQRTLAAVVLFALIASWQWTVSAQNANPKPEKPAKPGTRFEMDVVESFDAKYEGDTPGHIGRAGGLNDVRPNVALGDGVFNGEERIGTVTNIAWSRGQGSLTIEFDAAPDKRVAVGDHFWIDLNPTPKE